MPITQTELENVLKSNFPNGQITCRDLMGDQNHWEVNIVDPVFEGLSRVQQHKMVQRSVIEHDIHALSIKTAAK